MFGWPKDTTRWSHLGFSLLLVGSGAAGCSHAPVAQVATLDLPWERFWWVGGIQGGNRFDRLAMVIRSVEASGTGRWHQLDLGASGSMPDGIPEGRDVPSVAAQRLPGQLYGILGSTAQLEFFSPLPDSLRGTWGRREVGTLGLPLYLGKALVLDLPRERLAVIPATKDISPLLGPKAASVPIEGGYERVMFGLLGKDGTVYRTLLDTGLSPFPLWTTQATWRRLTGREGPATGVHRYEFSHPRGTMLFVGAPLKSELWIGSWRVPSIEVVFLAEGPEGAALEDWSPSIEAVAGPTLFAREGILVLDLAHRRLRLGRSPP